MLMEEDVEQRARDPFALMAMLKCHRIIVTTQSSGSLKPCQSRTRAYIWCAIPSHYHLLPLLDSNANFFQVNKLPTCCFFLFQLTSRRKFGPF